VLRPYVILKIVYKFRNPRSTELNWKTLYSGKDKRRRKDVLDLNNVFQFSPGGRRINNIHLSQCMCVPIKHNRTGIEQGASELGYNCCFELLRKNKKRGITCFYILTN
jgi:hypothetical protein